MAHLLYQLGVAALKPRVSGDKVLPPLIGFQEAMRLRERMYADNQPWPYEHIVPGPPKEPPGVEAYLHRRTERDKKKQQRLQEIQTAMAKMPELIEQYKASRRMRWEEVEPVDYLTMTRTAIRRKYTKRKLMKHGM